MKRTQSTQDGTKDLGRPVTYEQRLDASLSWAMSEGSAYFAGGGSVKKALRKITDRLNELGIPYAVAGGLALFAHGFRRFTEDVDILVTPEGLKSIHEELEGRGWLPPFEKAKNLRDTELGVRIEFLVTGKYPGDGKPKDIAFPDPAAVAVESEGIRYLNLPALVELKLAAGMTQPKRQKDFGDVIQLIEILALPRELVDQLHPYVRQKYDELWRTVHHAGQRFVLRWSGETEAERAEKLEAMRDAGLRSVSYQPEKVSSIWTADDPDIAARFGLHPEDEVMEDDE